MASQHSSGKIISADVPKDGEKMEKKPRPAAPPPPAALATASLLIRGAAAKVLGLRPGASGGDLQPLWVTEPGHAKVTMSLEGCTRSPFPKDDMHGVLIDAIEKATNELVLANEAITIFDLKRDDAEARYGNAVCDPNRAAKTDMLRLAYIPGAALVEIPADWSLCATTGGCGTVVFQQKDSVGNKKPDTMILYKKKQIMVRYGVGVPDATGVTSNGNGPPDNEAVAELDRGIVLVAVPGLDGPATNGTAHIAKDPPKCGYPKSEEVRTEPGARDGENDAEMEVDPWSVKGKIDYKKLVDQFGSTEISEELLSRIERITVGKGHVKKLHPWLTRGIFFSHRDLDLICTCVEQGKPFYLYTGRGPSSAAMHLGHLIPFMMTKWLQEAFDVPLVIQMTDDEKFLWKGQWTPEDGDNLMHYRYLTTENAKDIIACGFDKKKTFIFSDLEYVGHMYPNIVRIWKAITYSTARSAFGFVGESNIGQSAFPAVQAAPSFPSSFRIPLKGQDHMACLIPCAIDQDPYFRITRDIAHKIVPAGHPLKGKPALLHSKFFPPLQGATGKMSASDDSSAIFLTDSQEQIDAKIMKYAFSGGQVNAKEQREKGADLQVDVSYQWLRFFLEDEEELERIGTDYSSGKGDYWNTKSVKERLILELQRIVKEHNERRAKISDSEVAEWMEPRALDF